MDRDSVDWHGYIPAVTTPFTATGDLDLAAWAAQLDWLADQQMHGIVVAGTTGEWFSLTEHERADLFTAAAKQVGDRMTVLGGCNAYTAAEAIRHARAAQAAGLHGILLTPPPYVVPSREEILAFYREVSEAVDLPLCVYNWPRGTGVDLDTDLLSRLADLPTVVAVKNSTPDFGGFVRGLVALRHRVRYFGIPTSETGIELLTRIGGDGLMGAGAVLGADHPGFFRAVADGDLDRARRLGARDRVLMETWFGADYGARFASAQAILKHALTLRGVPAGHVRRPLLPLTADQQARVRATLAELDLI
ncbi:4-hydroxy-tetrahydrodipicolinate synthase [Catellatospora sp. TT07R-123]|uniref:dihydrodipicolinate synthase family protein n=1 Tax=Catellatospora sp. TT07R-123 TaxID=2733863 RepID=UPI001B2EA52B|nr:dihydrodipicolinate synthase family protein [Catellatospora sp. TT07R-123]GHJ47024.1 4-hydroxy-tetrahydrodipicolinate synthase [Catellatospora sp. TT07R-123]